jgi:uncharacterized peroxidase-related enzyme
MAFIDTTDANDAAGDVRAMYERQQKSWGYVPNYAKLFSHRPPVLGAWADMIAVIRAPVDTRTFELVTFAAACALGSSSCSLAHGKKLLERFLSPTEVAALAGGREADTTLSAGEVAMVRFARKLVRESSTVTQSDVDAMRANGIDDSRIFDIACIAAGRAFFANLVEGLGALPDPALGDLAPELVWRLAVGRAVDREPSQRITFTTQTVP